MEADVAWAGRGMGDWHQLPGDGVELTLCHVVGRHRLQLPISALGKAVAGHLCRILTATRGRSRDDPGAALHGGLQRERKELPRPAEDSGSRGHPATWGWGAPESRHPASRGRKASIPASELRGSEVQKGEVAVAAS